MSDASEDNVRNGKPVSIRSRVIIGVIMGLLGGTFFAMIIAALYLVVWLVLRLMGWRGGAASGSQVLTGALVFIACVYALSIAHGIWASLRRLK